MLSQLSGLPAFGFDISDSGALALLMRHSEVGGTKDTLETPARKGLALRVPGCLATLWESLVVMSTAKAGGHRRLRYNTCRPVRSNHGLD